MSESMSSEVLNLQNQLKQLQDNAKGLGAQLEATKQMYNNNLNSEIQLRSSLVILQQDNQELNQKNSSLTNDVSNLLKEIAGLKAQLNPAPAASSET